MRTDAGAVARSRIEHHRQLRGAAHRGGDAAVPGRDAGTAGPWLVSYAVGTLLGSSLLHLVPEALEQMPARQGVFALLAGILTFFVLEKLVIWRHCHEGDEECYTHSRAAALVIVGDAFHTFIDGAIIGAAVLTSAPLGHLDGARRGRP